MIYSKLDDRGKALVLEHINLARYLVTKSLPRRLHYLREEVESAAFVGLVEGISRWDPERGPARLSAYWSIRKRISDLLYRKHFKHEFTSSGKVRTIGNGDEVGDEVSIALSVATDGEYQEHQATLERDLSSVVRAELNRQIQARNGRCTDPDSVSELFINVHVLGDLSVTEAAAQQGVSKQAISAKLKRVIPAWRATCDIIKRGY